MALELTTKSGRVYRLDLEGGFWARSPHFHPQRIWALKAGKELRVPDERNKDQWRDDVPHIGEHLYIASSGEWYVSTAIVKIEEKDGWVEEAEDG